MDFKKGLVKTTIRDTEYRIAITNYNSNDGFYCIIDKIKYPIVFNIVDYKILYSIPSNTYYEPWTKRKVDKVNPLAITAWSPIKSKQKIKGKLLNNTFILK